MRERGRLCAELLRSSCQECNKDWIDEGSLTEQELREGDVAKSGPLFLPPLKSGDDAQSGPPSLEM